MGFYVKDCNCGSGEPREEILDGHGIFLCFACEECKAEKLGKYRPDIFEAYETDEDLDDDSYDEYGEDLQAIACDSYDSDLWPLNEHFYYD